MCHASQNLPEWSFVVNAADNTNKLNDMTLSEFLQVLRGALLYIIFLPIVVSAGILYIFYDDATNYRTEISIEFSAENNSLFGILKGELPPLCGVELFGSKKLLVLRTRGQSGQQVKANVSCAVNFIREKLILINSGNNQAGDAQPNQDIAKLASLIERIEVAREEYAELEGDLDLTLNVLKSYLSNQQQTGLIQSKSVQAVEIVNVSPNIEDAYVVEERPRWWNILLLSYVGSVLAVLGVALAYNELRRVLRIEQTESGRGSIMRFILRKLNN
jgi:hypothetical protein